MTDARFLEFNYNFLSNLESQRYLTPSDIKLKFIDRLSGKINTSQYSDLSTLKSRNCSTLCLSDSEKKCKFGDYTNIENVFITNNNLPFPNQFKFYNIFGTIRIVDKVRFDNIKNQFYLDEIERFKKLIISLFDEYKINWSILKTQIDAEYVDSCYVDTGYTKNTE